MTIGPENPYRVEVDHTAEMRCYVDSKPRSKSHNFDGDSHENGSDSIYNDDSPDIYGVSDSDDGCAGRTVSDGNSRGDSSIPTSAMSFHRYNRFPTKS